MKKKKTARSTHNLNSHINIFPQEPLYFGMQAEVFYVHFPFHHQSIKKIYTQELRLNKINFYWSKCSEVKLSFLFTVSIQWLLVQFGVTVLMNTWCMMKYEQLLSTIGFCTIKPNINTAKKVNHILVLKWKWL